MNGFRALFASAAALAVVGGALAARAAPPNSPPEPHREPQAVNPTTSQAIGEARQPAPWPTFGTVPAAPTDVRPLKAWKVAVLTTRAEGADLLREAAAEPWTLHDSEAWATDERNAAIPPPQITAASSEADTEAYAAALRARATPPPRKR